MYPTVALGKLLWDSGGVGSAQACGGEKAAEGMSVNQRPRDTPGGETLQRQNRCPTLTCRLYLCTRSVKLV